MKRPAGTIRIEQLNNHYGAFLALKDIELSASEEGPQPRSSEARVSRGPEPSFPPS